MSENNQAPAEPGGGFVGSLTEGFNNAQKAQEMAENSTTGVILDNKYAEDRIMENVTNRNPAVAVASIAMGAVKGEVCSPDQIREVQKREKDRYDGIPMLQLAQTGIEKTVGFFRDDEYKFGETTTKWVQRVDTVAKGILSGGTSVPADLVVQAGRDGMDAMDCKTGAIPKSPAEQLAAQAPAPPEPTGAVAFAAPERAPLDIPKSPAEMAGFASNEPVHSQPAPAREKSKSMEISGPSM